MKFSVLLPTRDRLELLRYAVESVLRQDYRDWEVIVSDNCSRQDVAAYVRSLNDPRVKYSRTDSLLPVTENWNRALQRGNGDYVVMLGDDDCLLPRYFTRLQRLIESYEGVDLVYHPALLFAYPGVIPGFPDGLLQPYGYADFLKGETRPFRLDRERARRAVRNSMNFRITFGFNMQFALFRRDLIDVLRAKGAFFQSPYPDYYAMNALFLNAARILVCPEPLVVIGMSTSSFGFHYINRSERAGVQFLGNAPSEEARRRLKDVLLPGADLNDSWLAAMECLRLNYGQDFALDVNHRRYRLLQIHACIAERRGADNAAPPLHELWPLLRPGEKLAGAALWIAAKVIHALPFRLSQIGKSALSALLGIHPWYSPRRVTGRYRNILEVFESPDPLREQIPS